MSWRMRELSSKSQIPLRYLVRTSFEPEAVRDDSTPLPFAFIITDNFSRLGRAIGRVRVSVAG